MTTSTSANTNPQSAIIAMSGGVDSSVAAYLTQAQGIDCAGVTLKLFDNATIGDTDVVDNVDDNENKDNKDSNDNKDNNACNINSANTKTCCSLADVEDARKVAYSLDIPFYVYNFTTDFKTHVIDRFIAAYKSGATPNPCIDCNRYIKFEKLIARAISLNKDCVVTGHYAQIERGDNGRYLLKKSVDLTKDQTYVLYSLTQNQLAHVKFPLGAMCKTDVRKIANDMGFVNANKQDSQDICFVPNGDYAEFIERTAGIKFERGNFVDAHGKVLGEHKGIIRYTIGQRKGLGIALQKPMYVKSINVRDNTVTLCENDGLFSRELFATDFNWIAINNPAPQEKLRVKAKVRYNQEEQWAWAEVVGGGEVRVVFDEPQRAIAAGQAVVLYDGDVVVGGGTITT